VIWLYFHTSPTPEYLTLKITQLEERVGELEAENYQLKLVIKQKDELHAKEVHQLFDHIATLAIKVNSLDKGQNAIPIPGRVMESQERKLRTLIQDSFTMDEFKIVLSDAGIPSERDLNDKQPYQNYIQDAIDLCQRRLITTNLIEVLKKERPHIDWYGTK